MFETTIIQEDDPFRRIRTSVKACTCASGSCPSHGDAAQTESETSIHSAPIRRSSISSLRRRFEKDELKLSLSSLVSPCTEPADNENTAEQAAAVYEKWLAEKEERRRRLEEDRKMIEQMLIAEQQKKIEMERNNFINWLKTKKAEQERKKREELEELNKKQSADEEEKQKRQLENQLSYQLWRKRKEQKYLENKLKEQIDKVRTEEARQKRLELNQQAYEEWLRNSRYKPRPLPLNRGIDSLRASVSVSYVNPMPWEPNIETLKPTSK